jgi:hypothetical protein
MDQSTVLEPFVISFVNKSFEIGEKLIDEKLINNDDLDDLGSCIIIGLPLLAVLHCIEKSSNFDDGNIYLSVDQSIKPDSRKFPSQIQQMLIKMQEGIVIYRSIDFTCETYEKFKKSIIDKHKIDTDIEEQYKELYNILYDITLHITQIDEFKKTYANIIELLKSLSE